MAVSKMSALVKFQLFGSFILFGIAVVVLIVLSFSQRRAKKGLSTCNGVLGIVPPINFLNPRHRLVYVLACGLVASSLLSIIIQSPSVEVENKWFKDIVQSIYVVFITLLLVIQTYPLLACVQSPVPLLGYSLGALYTIVYFVYDIVLYGLSINAVYKSSMIEQLKKLLYATSTVTVLPQILCLIGVIVWYLYKLIKEIVRLRRADSDWRKAITQQPKSENQINYVKHLLQRNPVKIKKYFFSGTTAIRNPVKIKKYFFSGLQLPLPVLIAIFVATLILFQMTVLTSFLCHLALLIIAKIFTSIHHHIHTILIATIISPIISFIFSCALMAHFIYSVKKNMKKEKSDLPSKPINWPALTLASSVRYAGYQVAVIFTAWILYTIAAFIIVMAIISFIGFPSLIGYLLYKLFVIVVWFGLLLGLQLVACKIFFITNDSSIMKTVVIDNRRLFNLFSYTVFLYNIVTGLFTAILRLMFSILFMILILPRMDRVLYVKGFERFDSIHSIFKNFMTMEALLHNPIVHTFVHMLSDDLPNLHSNRSYGTISELGHRKTSSPHRVSRKAYNRWFVAYTLIKNPSLSSLRKNHVSVVNV